MTDYQWFSISSTNELKSLKLQFECTKTTQNLALLTHKTEIGAPGRQCKTIFNAAKHLYN